MSEDRRIIYDGDWKDGQKHGQGFEGGVMASRSV